MPTSNVTMRDIYLARRRITSIAKRTPLVHSPLLAKHVGCSVHLKLESLQETGSLKIRGAANKMLSLTAKERARGVVTGSSGNHGRAVAHVASRLGVNAVICVSARVPSNKADAISRLGAEIVVYGKSYDESVSHTLRLVEVGKRLKQLRKSSFVWWISAEGACQFWGKCHCERSEAISPPALGDCFVAKGAPRNDRLGRPSVSPPK